jgi:hypothetical protein
MTSPIRSQITSPVSPAALPGKAPFTIPLRTLLIVRCQPVVFESTTYVPGDAAGGSRIRTIGPARTTRTRMA